MNIRNVEDCFKMRLLRKIHEDTEKSEKSLLMAKARLTRAREALQLKIEYTILEAYMAMFHAARALLYRDGIQEKSHFAISVYLKEKYAGKILPHVLSSFDVHRIERHESMYGLEYNPEEKDALAALEDAERFVTEIEKMLRSP